MPKNEKQYGYSRKWDKDNIRTLATRVRTDVADNFKKYCEEKGTSCTSEVKRLIEAALEEVQGAERTGNQAKHGGQIS